MAHEINKLSTTDSTAALAQFQNVWKGIPMETGSAYWLFVQYTHRSQFRTVHSALGPIIWGNQKYRTKMAKKKMSKQDKKKAEAEQAEALRIEMEKQRFLIDLLFISFAFIVSRNRFFVGKSNSNSSENEWYWNWKRQKSVKSGKNTRINCDESNWVKAINTLMVIETFQFCIFWFIHPPNKAHSNRCRFAGIRDEINKIYTEMRKLKEVRRRRCQTNLLACQLPFYLNTLRFANYGFSVETLHAMQRFAKCIRFGRFASVHSHVVSRMRKVQSKRTKLVAAHKRTHYTHAKSIDWEHNANQFAATAIECGRSLCETGQRSARRKCQMCCACVSDAIILHWIRF